MPTTDLDLPAELRLLMDTATSRAKKLGHGTVRPAHVLQALIEDRPDFADKAIDSATRALAAASLADERRTFDSPQPDADTVRLFTEVAQRPDPIAALAEELRIALTQQPPGATAGRPAVGDGPPEAAAATTSGPAALTLSARVRSFAELVPPVELATPRTALSLRLAGLLAARTPQTPLIVAPQGGGRTTLAACLALALRDLPEGVSVRGMPVVRVRTEAIVGTGETGSGLKALIEETRGRAVIFVDDVEVLTGLGINGHLFVGVLQALRSALHDPDVRIAVSVSEEYVDRLQTAERELFDELERVQLDPLSGDEVRTVAEDAARLLGAHHRVRIGPEVIAGAVSPPRQVDTQVHPGLAVARLDRAAAAAALRGEAAAHPEDLGVAVAGQQYVVFDVAGARSRLKSVVFGQDDVIDRVTHRLALTRAALDLRPERPDGVFLFAGPTGTGKTFLAQKLALEIFGSQEALTRLDMSELSEQHAVSKLIGSPPGYVGSTEPESWLTTKVRRRPQSVILLDEVEKAHPVVWNTFLQVFDAGRLTDTLGRVADFRDTVIVLTTNVGSEVFAERADVGFSGQRASARADDHDVRAELRRWMRPELLNRFDEVLVLGPLDAAAVAEVARASLADALARLHARGWDVDVDPSILQLLIDRGYSRQYGARPMLRTIESLILAPLAELPPGTFKVSRSGDDVIVEAR